MTGKSWKYWVTRESLFAVGLPLHVRWRKATAEWAVGRVDRVAVGKWERRLGTWVLAMPLYTAGGVFGLKLLDAMGARCASCWHDEGYLDSYATAMHALALHNLKEGAA